MWCRLDPCEGQAWVNYIGRGRPRFERGRQGRTPLPGCCQVRVNLEYVGARGTYDRSDRSTERVILTQSFAESLFSLPHARLRGVSIMSATKPVIPLSSAS